MYLLYEDRYKPQYVVEFLEIRRLIEERIRLGDRRTPVEIYDEFALVAETMRIENQ